jgi:predicted GNAT superfamily acetyltransferase
MQKREAAVVSQINDNKSTTQKLSIFRILRAHLIAFGQIEVIEQIQIREVTELDEMAECVQIQREVFGLPECELSPIRHFVVTKNAGGFVIGAFDCERLAGFVLSVPAFMRGKKAFYSHMTGVRQEYQSHGIGAKLKWAQRSRAMANGVKYIKWTFEPVKARNAYFNIEKLGAVVREYKPNFYGTDYATSNKIGLASDRLFAEWHLESEKVVTLAAGGEFTEKQEPEVQIVIIMTDWLELVNLSPEQAIAEQARIPGEFETAFKNGLTVSGFSFHRERPAYVLYEKPVFEKTKN